MSPRVVEESGPSQRDSTSDEAQPCYLGRGDETQGWAPAACPAAYVQPERMQAREARDAGLLQRNEEIPG